MAVRLSAEDFQRLVQIVQDLPGFATTVQERRRWLDLAFAGEPAASRLLGLISLDGMPLGVATELVKGLADYGRLSSNREALEIFLTTILPSINEEAHAFVIGLLAAYSLGRPAVPGSSLGARRARTSPAQAQEKRTGEHTLRDVRGLELERHIADYCRAMVAQAERVFEQFVELSGQARPGRLPDPYALDIDDLIEPPEVHALRQRAAEAAFLELPGGYAGRGAQEMAPVASVRERLLAIQRGVLLGEPGSGKSWTLLRLLYDHATRWLAAHEAGTTPNPAPIPVLVRLNRFTGQEEGAKGQSAPQTIAAFVQAALRGLAPAAEHLCAEGRLVLLCDALNEMPRRLAGVDGAPDRDLVAELRDYLADLPAFLVSCRVRDYHQDLEALQPLEQLRLLELELPDIREAIWRRLGEEMGAALWTALGGSDELLAFHTAVNEHAEPERFWDTRAGIPHYTSTAADRAWQAAIQRGSRLIPLCRTPYMLAMICGLYATVKQLPTNRGELFGRFVATLLRREEAAAARTGRIWPGTERVQVALVVVAERLQRAQATTLEAAEVLTAIAEADAPMLLEAASAADLLAVDDGRVRFSHQLLQEYFAAELLRRAMAEARPPDGLFSSEWWDGQEWRETVVILGERLQADGEGAAGPNRVARWLAPHSPELAWEVLERNGTGLSPADVEPATTQQLIDGARGRTSEAQPVGRAAAYRVLGRLEADARPGVGLRDGVPDLSWRRVPAGPCPMGGDPAAFNDWAGQMIDLPYDFWIARYPVTVAQYAAFVADGGYTTRQRGCWTRAGWQWKGDREAPWLRANPRWHLSNHPVVGVSWYEAYAYTRWLEQQRRSGRLPLPRAIPAEHGVRLATEAEWEKAARWPDGRVYPYGNEYDTGAGNTDETGIGRTSAVGVFAGGAAACGAEELSGNVWEWCLSAWQESYRHRLSVKVEGTTPRVLRGGSWDDDRSLARAASRDRSGPGDRSIGVGFRVVVSAPLPAPGL